MKKLNVLTIAALLFIGFSFSSCSKCVTCTTMGIETEVCEEDFASSDEYDAAVAAVELVGGSCN